MTYHFMAGPQVSQLPRSLLWTLVSAPTFRSPLSHGGKSHPAPRPACVRCLETGEWCKRPAPPRSIVMASWRMAWSYITRVSGPGSSLVQRHQTLSQHEVHGKIFIKILIFSSFLKTILLFTDRSSRRRLALPGRA